MEMLDAALSYLERGWSIIPLHSIVNGQCTCNNVQCTNVGKHPAVKWKEFQTRQPSEKEVRMWFERWPNINIALVTGRISDMVVIDIDPRHGGNRDDVFQQLHTGVEVASGGGGSHLYYVYPSQFPQVFNRAGIKQGVDVRGDGGYVLLPPSRHSSGAIYQWTSDGIPGDLPDSVVRSINGEDSEGTGNRHGDGKNPYWVSRLLETGAPAGQRNDSCARLAGYFAKVGTPADITITVLNNWNEKNEEPLSNNDIRVTVDSVYRTKDRKSGRFSTPDTESHSDRPLFDLVKFNDYIIEHGTSEIKWAVDGWLPEKTIAFMVAAPETYKTWLLLDLAVSLASGQDFLGMYPVRKAGPVIVVQQEDFHGQMAERAALIASSKYQAHNGKTSKKFSVPIPKDIPVYLHPNRELKFHDVAVMDKLEEHIAELRPKAVLIDPLYSAGSTDEYMTKTVEHMWRIKELRDKYGCSFVLAHHTKKLSEDNKGTAREDLWGSQFLNAFLETGWQMRRTDAANTIKVRRHFKASQGEQEMHLNFDINTRVYPFHYRIRETDAPQSTKGDKIVDLLRDCGVGLSVTEIAQRLETHHSQISRLVTKLQADNMVIKDKDGKVMLTAKAVV